MSKKMTDFSALRQKTYSYLTNDNDQNKKAKDTKKFVIKKKLKCEDYKHFLEAIQLQNKTNQLEKNKLDRVRENRKEIIKDNSWILKSQQRFRSEKHSVFSEEVKKNTLSASNDKRIQSVDSIETYAHGTNEEIIHRKEEIKCNSIIKQY